MKDYIEIPWSLYPIVPLLWLVGVVAVAIGLLTGRLR